MQNSERAALAAFKAVLKPDGFKVSMGHGGKHPHIVVVATCGWPKEIAIPCSPRSGAQAQANFARQKAQRLLCEYKQK